MLAFWRGILNTRPLNTDTIHGELVAESTRSLSRRWVYTFYSVFFTPRIGLLILAGGPIVLFALSLHGATIVTQSVVTTGALVIVSVGLLYGLKKEWDTTATVETYDVPTVRTDAQYVTAVMGGAIVTLIFTIELPVSSIVAASLVALFGALIIPKFAVAIYCGAFVGMTSPLLFTTYTQALLAGFLAGGVFVLCRPVFDGVGGKLGTTAFVAATAVVAVTVAEFHSDPLPSLTTQFLIYLYAVSGAVVTFMLSVRFDRGPVVASATVGAISGILLPVIYPTDGSLLAAVVFCASFVGMVSADRLADEFRVAVAGAVAGLIFIYTTPYVGGSGGKLGTIAFGACLTVWGGEALIQRLKTLHK